MSKNNFISKPERPAGFAALGEKFVTLGKNPLILMEKPRQVAGRSKTFQLYEASRGMAMELNKW